MVRANLRGLIWKATAALCITCARWCSAEPNASVDPPRLEVKIEHVSSGRTYALGRAAIGELPYVDRRYAFRRLPHALLGHVVVQSSMEDDFVEAVDHVRLRLSAPATIFVGVDGRGSAPPAWLKDWTKSEQSLAVDDVSYHLFQRNFPAGIVTLGGNDRRRTGARSNYVVIIAPANPALSKRISPFNVADFADKVQPLLSARCFSCHGPEVQEGGLRLDVRRRALLGGDSGPAITPGAGDTSELIARLVTTDATKRMPQGGKSLSQSEIALLRHWIDSGAAWPDELADREDFGNHWSFAAIRRSPLPAAANREWVRTPIDAFVLARLEQARIQPSLEADRRTLIRRLTFDLLGLPPRPAEVQQFLADERPDAYERLVDRLLDSKHFGERWGKHWLDLARFAESDGYENDNPRPHAWRYRDWVINAINDDVPFDRFTIQQLAGDLLDNSRPADRIATAFHRSTLHNSAGGADAEEFRSKAVKDRTAVTGAVWMGLTLNCCECHTHKYDPISHREYYRLYAFFNNAEHASEGDVPTLRAAARSTKVHRRGNFLDLGAAVEPGTPSFLPPLAPRGPMADRLDLARWLVSPEHPLTARVAVNHVWQHLFGQGLVPTPENFGLKGEPPTNPELLDWLAAEFAGLPPAAGDAGATTRYVAPWSRKSLIRLIVRSSVYRQSSAHPQTPPAADPDNRWLWRQNRFRMEAETVRDIGLAASGLLDTTIGGPSIQPPLPKGLGQRNELKNERFQETTGNPHRRGLYIHMQRTFPYPMLATFDGPDGNQCVMLRDRSTTPLQALTQLNDPAVDECARALGRRLRDATLDDVGRIHEGFELCLTRTPADAEVTALQDLLDALRGQGANDEAVWYGVARTLLNLDETITRE